MGEATLTQCETTLSRTMRVLRRLTWGGLLGLLGWLPATAQDAAELVGQV